MLVLKFICRLSTILYYILPWMIITDILFMYEILLIMKIRLIIFNINYILVDNTFLLLTIRMIITDMPFMQEILPMMKIKWNIFNMNYILVVYMLIKSYTIIH